MIWVACCTTLQCLHIEAPLNLAVAGRGGRGGGYKELDKEEIAETRRRRREAEADDGEMYDEFGNLKKKYRVKVQETEAVNVSRGTGCAGWEVEERAQSSVCFS